MKLGCKNVVAPNGGNEIQTIASAGRHDRVILRLWMKTMYEINVTAIVDALIDRALRLRDLDLVPTDLRNFQPLPFRKSNDVPSKKSKPGGAAIEFFAMIEHRLIADANP